jgi:acetyltransferase-like isoleucine patch superfamily enzyme
MAIKKRINNMANILVKGLLHLVNSSIAVDNDRILPNQLLCRNPTLSMYPIGAYSYGDPAPRLIGFGLKAPLKIGKFCLIGQGVTILLGSEHRPDWVTTYPFNFILDEFKEIKGTPITKGSVTIGNDVWIGMNAFILDGVSIADGAVIGACSVVTNNVEPYTIVAGNPARVIRKRFDRETINKLLKIKWWDWNIDRIKENMPLLLSNRIEEFIEKNHL